MNTIREIKQNNEKELELGIAGTNASWHEQYSTSPWIYVGNLHPALTEGDVLCFLSQYGEIEDIHLVRHPDTGKSRGYAFVKYDDPRSCILAVDNFIGIELCGKSIRIDHVTNYRVPKSAILKRTDGDNDDDEGDDDDDDDLVRTAPGHAYKGVELANHYTLQNGVDLFAPPQTQKQRQEQLIINSKMNESSKSANDSQTNNDDNDRVDDQHQQQQQQQKLDVNDNSDDTNNSRMKRKLERRLKREAKARRHQDRHEQKHKKRRRKDEQKKESKSIKANNKRLTSSSSRRMEENQSRHYDSSSTYSSKNKSSNRSVDD